MFESLTLQGQSGIFLRLHGVISTFFVRRIQQKKSRTAVFCQKFNGPPACRQQAQFSFEVNELLGQISNPFK